MRFLIADDHIGPRDFLKRVLLQAGHEVVGAAADGSEALKLCRARRPDAVIFDIDMVPMNGQMAAKVVVADKLARHVFIASLRTQKAIIAPLQQLGCVFIAKPFVKEQLLAAIAKATAPTP